MNKKNRNIIILCYLIILISVVILIASLIYKNNNQDNNNVENNNSETYTMYVKINPVVKLTFKKTKNKCIIENASCYDIGSEIIDYELINDDAKEIYKDLIFVGKNVEDVLIMLCETARNNNISFNNLEITTDSPDYTEDYIIKEINKNSEHEKLLNVIINFQEYLNDTEILNEYGAFKEQNINYTITFESDGGTKIENQIISINELVKEPVKPTKEGYTFVEWRLNNKAFNFNTKVTEDIILKAIWQKNKEESSTNKNNITTTTQPQTTIASKEENKITSTINKINLNENILMDEYQGTGTMCTYYIFSTNINDIMPVGSIKNRSIDINEVQDFETLMNDVIYDTQKEQNALARLNNLIPPIGIVNFSVSNNNHRIKYRMDRLNISSGQNLAPFSTEYTNSQINFENQIKSIFNEAYWIYGGCGMGPETILLNEDKCNQYNLICDRW